MDNNLIKETENYKLVVGYSTSSKPGEQPLLAYLIINKKYNVVEVETFLLPQALKYLKDLDEGLNMVMSDNSEQNAMYSKAFNKNLN
ncbi:hypothetical protein [Caudoviricetes sp.]|nr:hypothetical protein [Caudoviricetes sp.]